MPFVNPHRKSAATVAMGRQAIELAWATPSAVARRDFGTTDIPINVCHASLPVAKPPASLGRQANLSERTAVRQRVEAIDSEERPKPRWRSLGRQKPNPGRSKKSVPRLGSLI